MSDPQRGRGIVTECTHLGLVADDAGVRQQLRLSLLVVGCDALGIEALVGLSISVAAVQDRGPRQAGLCPFQAEHLEELAFIMHWPTPLQVVVGDHVWIVPGPIAASPRRHVVHARFPRVTLERVALERVTQ